MTIRIGCQGWNYDDWTTKALGETVFYPRGTKSGEMLERYGEVYDTVEIDSTFYAIPSVASIENWNRKTPDGFVFALKLPQQITHDAALRPDSYEILDDFCERVRPLGAKLGPVLVQLPPQFGASKENAVVLRRFLERLPKDIRFAVEFRDRGWIIDWTCDELAKNEAALALVEGSWIPRPLMFGASARMSTPFNYVRFMGERDLTAFDRIYRLEDAALEAWASEVRRLERSDAFVYFSNFFEGHAPASVNRLKALLGQEVTPPEELENQGTLF